MQLPPVRSRVKRQEREREIYEFKILKKEGKDIEFRVRCQAGTYIRKLVHDLGEELKVGAHMTELRRIRAGLFEEKTLVTIEEFEKAVKEFKEDNPKWLDKIITPAEEIIKKILPVIRLETNSEYLKKIRTGSPIFKKYIEKIEKEFEKGQNLACFYDNQLIEIAEADIASREFTKIDKEAVIARPKTVFIS